MTDGPFAGETIEEYLAAPWRGLSPLGMREVCTRILALESRLDWVTRMLANHTDAIEAIEGALGTLTEPGLLSDVIVERAVKAMKEAK